MERGTVEWNSGMVEWWNSGMVEWSSDDPVPLIPAYCACAVHSASEDQGKYIRVLLD